MHPNTNRLGNNDCRLCRKPIGCGCQKATASTGVPVHKGCLAAYEAGIKAGTITKTR